MSENGSDQGDSGKRSRATAKILESKTFKDGAIYLYRRADYKKPTWFIRLKVPGLCCRREHPIRGCGVRNQKWCLLVPAAKEPVCKHLPPFRPT